MTQAGSGRQRQRSVQMAAWHCPRLKRQRLGRRHLQQPHHGVDLRQPARRPGQSHHRTCHRSEKAERDLNATIDPESLATDYQFEYGKTTAYGAKVPAAPKSVGSGTIGVAVSQTPTGLWQGRPITSGWSPKAKRGSTMAADMTFDYAETAQSKPPNPPPK